MVDAIKTPTPDPTILTTEQLLREIGSLKDTFEKEIVALSTLMDEKLKSVDKQLALVENQRIEQKSDTKAAVDAALTAQKEAVKEQTAATATAIAKSETITSEQLKQLGISFATAIAGQTVVLGDIKDRVVKIESIKLGGQETSLAIRAMVSLGIAVLLAAIAVVGFIVANKP